MNTVGQIEKKTQQRIVRLFSDPEYSGSLGYRYLGNWQDRENNSNIELDILAAFLEKQGYDAGLIKRALQKFTEAADDKSKQLYDRNRAVYEMLRYGVKPTAELGENTQTVWLIDWQNPQNNDFAIAEEVTVSGADPQSFAKRPDIVLYVNGIALGVLELKRSTIPLAESIRQNLDNQKPHFIQPFFSTMQLIMAGNDSEGARYGTIETSEKYYLNWKEEGESDASGPQLDRQLSQMCRKERFLELIHDFIVFDFGKKKLCRPNQYFGVRATQEFINRREGGIIWHTQGSGKSLTMVWLAKWIRENVPGSRVLLITDRIELDDQIEKVFFGVNEKIYRTKSGADLIAKLNNTEPSLICSLVHKFARRNDDKSEEESSDIKGYVAEVERALPTGFQAKGDLYVFVDECHRTQSGELHDAMKTILPNAVFIGFTGTPLLKADKQKSIEVFGRYIHTYKFDEAVGDKVVLDLRYEARDIEQQITSQNKIDQWFESKTQGLTDLARAQLKQRWGTMQKVLSSQDRLKKIVADILLDMETRDRLKSGRGNALLVSGSIYQACKSYELFSQTDLAGKCAIVTSYKPSQSSIKGEESGEGQTERLRQYDIYKKMLGDWFGEAPEIAVNKIDKFEREVKEKFIKEPGQMKLLIVVDKLLTGFDAPSATYLYIDKQMHDHSLFQAICRVNRLDGDDKEYGYIIDYKDLFKSLEGAVNDYTSGEFDVYDKEDVAGLLENRISKGRERLEEAREEIRALCEPVQPPKGTPEYLHYFNGTDAGNAAQLKENEPKRLSLYKLAASLLRSYANLANELDQAGYSAAEIEALKTEVEHYERVRTEVKIASGDYVDLKMYEPAMRHLIDTYIRAEESEKISAFDDMSLVQLVIERGPDAVDALPAGIRQNQSAVAETIENNVRKLIIDEQPINPKYYEKMSELLDSLIEQRKNQALEYRQYLEKITELTRQAKNPTVGATYPATLDTGAKRSLYDNLGKDETKALAIDEAIYNSRQHRWRGNFHKERRIAIAVYEILQDEAETERILELAKSQSEY